MCILLKRILSNLLKSILWTSKKEFVLFAKKNCKSIFQKGFCEQAKSILCNFPKRILWTRKSILCNFPKRILWTRKSILCNFPKSILWTSKKCFVQTVLAILTAAGRWSDACKSKSTSKSKRRRRNLKSISPNWYYFLFSQFQFLSYNQTDIIS